VEETPRSDRSHSRHIAAAAGHPLLGPAPCPGRHSLGPCRKRAGPLNYTCVQLSITARQTYGLKKMGK